MEIRPAPRSGEPASLPDAIRMALVATATCIRKKDHTVMEWIALVDAFDELSEKVLDR